MQQNVAGSIVLEQPEALETSELHDLGEASPPTLEQQEAEAQTNRENRVEANIELSADLREKMVASNYIDSSYEQEFILADVAPGFKPKKGREIKTELDIIAQNLASDDEDVDERKALKADQARLALEYSYNTTALLNYVYNQEVAARIIRARKQLSMEAGSDIPDTTGSIIELLNSAKKGIEQIGELRTIVEIFKVNVDKAVGEMIADYQLDNYAYTLNQSVRIKCDKSSLDSPDRGQSQSLELASILSELLEKISPETISTLIARIDSIITKFESNPESALPSSEPPGVDPDSGNAGVISNTSPDELPAEE